MEWVVGGGVGGAVIWVGLGGVDVVVGRVGIYGAGDGLPSSVGGLGWVGLMWLWVALGSMGQEKGRMEWVVGGGVGGAVISVGWG